VHTVGSKKKRSAVKTIRFNNIKQYLLKQYSWDRHNPSDLFHGSGIGKPRTSSQTTRDFDGGAVELEEHICRREEVSARDP